MAKRFTDTEIWDKEWFMTLTPKLKCLVTFIFSKCDQAGIWSPNWLLASSFIGEPVCEKDLFQLKNQFEILRNGKIFVIDFIKFQYGELTEKCMPHRKVIALLKSHGVFERVSKGYQYPTSRVQEEEKDKEEDKDKEKEGVEKFEIVLPFDGAAFTLAWASWKRYKKEEHRFNYKSTTTEQAALVSLMKVSEGDELTSIKIISQSIANGWKGFFALKDELNAKQTSNNTGVGLNSSFKQQLAADLLRAGSEGGSAVV